MQPATIRKINKLIDIIDQRLERLEAFEEDRWKKEFATRFFERLLQRIEKEAKKSV